MYFGGFALFRVLCFGNYVTFVGHAMAFVYHVNILWVILLRTWSTLKTAVVRFGSLPTWNSNDAVMHSFWTKSNTNWLVIVAAKCQRVQSTRSRLKFQCRGITSRRRVDRGVPVFGKAISVGLPWHIDLFTNLHIRTPNKSRYYAARIHAKS